MNFTPIILMCSILIVVAVLLVVADHFLGGKKDSKITINNELVVPVSGDGILLGCLAEKKIFIPSACGGKATCGHCKVTVLKGGGNVLPTEAVLLNAQEKQSGVRLACQVKVRDDIEISIPEHLLNVQEFTAKVVGLHDLTSDIIFLKLKLESPDTISFKPGQYVQIKVPGIEVFRAYSVASEPNQSDSIEFTIRLVPKGICSTYVHKALEIGDRVTFTGPYGDFFLQEDSDKNIIGIAGGCGMAPIRSIVHYLKEKNMPRNMIYFFGARSKKDLFYTEDFKKIEAEYPNFRYIPALSEPKPEDNWLGETGFIHQSVEKYIESAANSEAYLCGPPPMIDAAVKVLIQKGIKKENIYFDKF